HAGWGKYPSIASLFDQLTNPAQSVSFTAATRSVEPVSTELLSLPARACFTGHRVQQNERLNEMTKELRSSESPGIRADILSASSRSHIEAMQVAISPLVAINRTEPLMRHR
ncbi:hypothetical protein J6590_094883, partial [Homalodisca vitripennis]